MTLCAFVVAVTFVFVVVVVVVVGSNVGFNGRTFNVGDGALFAWPFWATIVGLLVRRGTFSARMVTGACFSSGSEKKKQSLGSFFRKLNFISVHTFFIIRSWGRWCCVSGWWSGWSLRGSFWFEWSYAWCWNGYCCIAWLEKYTK